MGKNKKFIDKKHSATFQLLARDSSDPNYDASPSGDRVFVRVDNNPYAVDSFFGEHNDAVSPSGQFVDDPNSVFADAPDDHDDDGCCGGVGFFGEPPVQLSATAAAVPLPDHVRREILELGLPDDGYNYLIHLREIKNTGGGSAYYHNPKAKLDQLPRDVKAYDASRVEVSRNNDDANGKSIYTVASRTVGVRVQKAVDPEVAALLDDSDLSRFGSDVEDLEEDFVVKANLPEDEEEVEFDKKLTLVEELEVNRTGSNVSKAPDLQEYVVDSTGGDEFRNNHESCMDEKLRVRRPLDEQFDMLQLQEYATDSEDEYGGSISEENEHNESLAEKLTDALKERATKELDLDESYKVPADLLNSKEQSKDAESLDSAVDVIRKCMEYAKSYDNNDEDEDVVVLEESSDESEKWDCETIVSTYSNLDNHPGKIIAPEIRRKKKLAAQVSEAFSSPSHVIPLSRKEKLPVDFLPCRRKSEAGKDKNVTSLKKEQQQRKKHGQESNEQKKERKAAVKAEKSEARRLKKEIKGLYRSEAQHAQRVAASSGPSSIHLM